MQRVGWIRIEVYLWFRLMWRNMEEENLRLCIKPAHSGHLCLIQYECKYTGTTITNNKMKAEISTKSLPSVTAISLCRGLVCLWSIIKTRSYRSGSCVCATKRHQHFSGTFLEVQIPKPHPKLTKSDTLVMRPRNLSLRWSCCTLMFGNHNLATQSMVCSQHSGEHGKHIRNKEPWAPPHGLHF